MALHIMVTSDCQTDMTEGFYVIKIMMRFVLRDTENILWHLLMDNS